MLAHREGLVFNLPSMTPRPALAFLIALALLGAATEGVVAAPPVAPKGTAADAPRTTLNADEMSAALKIDTVTIPTPGEFFAALDKQGKRNWPSLRRNVVPTSAVSRAQMAMNLGTLIADGYIAVEAQDGQQVKNVGKDILTLAKALGVSQDILNRGQSIGDFAENNDWTGLKEELEATQNEVKLAMAKQKDNDLVVLVSLGAWVRGIQAASGLVDRDYSPAAAQLLRQAAVIDFLLAEMADLPTRMREDPVVDSVRTGLESTRTLVSVPRGQPFSPEQTNEVFKKTSAMVEEISAVPLPASSPSTAAAEPAPGATP